METKANVVSSLANEIFNGLSHDKVHAGKGWHSVCQSVQKLRQLPDKDISVALKLAIAEARKDFAKANPDLNGSDINGLATMQYLRAISAAVNRTDSAAPEAIADRLPVQVGTAKGGAPVYETRSQYRDRMAKPSSGRGTQTNSNGSNGGNAPAPVAEAMMKALSASDGTSEPLQRRAAEILARAAAEGWSLAAWQSVVAALEAAVKVHAVKQAAPAAKSAAKKSAAKKAA